MRNPPATTAIAPPRPVEPRSRHDPEENRGDRHRRRDRESERGGQPVGRSEREDNADCRREQQPIQTRQVNLPNRRPGRVHDVHARREAELRRLPCEREDGRDERLRRDDGRRRRERDHRIENAFRNHRVERTGCGARILKQKGRLAEIVERQRGEGEREPRDPNRARTEVSHVCVQRFAAGKAQHDGAERQEAARSGVRKETHGVPRIDGLERHGILCERVDAENGDHHEPRAEDRTEDAADSPGAAPLQGEESDEDHDGERHDEPLECRRRDLNSFDRAEYRDGGRDHAVAVEHRRSEQTERDDELRPVHVNSVAEEQREEGEHAALAAIPRAHEHGDVLEAHHQHQRPQEQRRDAEHVFRSRRDASPAVKRLLHRVQRARAEVAENDAEGRDRGEPERGPRHGRSRVRVSESKLDPATECATLASWTKTRVRRYSFTSNAKLSRVSARRRSGKKPGTNEPASP